MFTSLYSRTLVVNHYHHGKTFPSVPQDDDPVVGQANVPGVQAVVTVTKVEVIPAVTTGCMEPPSSNSTLPSIHCDAADGMGVKSGPARSVGFHSPTRTHRGSIQPNSACHESKLKPPRDIKCCQPPEPEHLVPCAETDAATVHGPQDGPHSIQNVKKGSTVSAANDTASVATPKVVSVTDPSVSSSVQHSPVVSPAPSDTPPQVRFMVHFHRTSNHFHIQLFPHSPHCSAKIPPVFQSVAWPSPM